MYGQHKLYLTDLTTTTTTKDVKLGKKWGEGSGKSMEVVMSEDKA